MQLFQRETINRPDVCFSIAQSTLAQGILRNFNNANDRFAKCEVAHAEAMAKFKDGPALHRELRKIAGPVMLLQ